MKSAYELAMERLNKNAPTQKLTEDQKKQIADIDSLYKARIAERELFLEEQLNKARVTGDAMAVEQVREELLREKKKLQAESEEKKEAVRHRSV